MIRPLFAAVIALAACAPVREAAEPLQCNPLDLDAEYAEALIRECRGVPLSECPEWPALREAYINAVVERCGQ